MNYKLYIQHPKPKLVGVGSVAVDNNKAMFFIGNSLNQDIERPRLEWMAVKGMWLSGFEETGVDIHLRKKFIFQEWFLEYIEEE